MSTQDLIVDTPEPGIRRLVLNRPEKLNALSRSLVDEIDRALVAAEREPALRVVVILAAGDHFCSGADLSEHFLDDPGEAPDIGRMTLWDRLENLALPVIAGVQGWAITGGFLLAYCCDLVVAAEDARFRDSHAAIGVLPTGGETQRMARRLGVFLARELMLTSRPLGAQEAHQRGFVSRVAPRAELESAVLETARAIVAGAPRSIAAIKRGINAGNELDFASGVRLEAVINRFGAANLEPDAERDERLRRFHS